MKQLTNRRRIANIIVMTLSDRKRLAARRAFTLIELLVVAVIIGILAALVVAKFQAAFRKARESRTYLNLYNYRLGIKQYYLANDYVYPTWIICNSSWHYWVNPMDPNHHMAPQNNGSWVWNQLQPYMGRQFEPSEVARDGKESNLNEVCGKRQFLNCLYYEPQYNLSVCINSGWISSTGPGYWYRIPSPPSSYVCNDEAESRLALNNTSKSTEGKRYVDY